MVATVIAEATVLALVYIGRLASEPWISVRHPTPRQLFGTRNLFVLVDDESASRTKKQAYFASPSSVIARYYAPWYSLLLCLAPPMS